MPTERKPPTNAVITSTMVRLLNCISRFSQALRMVTSGRSRKLSAEMRTRSVYSGFSKNRATSGALKKKAR